jgi:hypothetical protein
MRTSRFRDRQNHWETGGFYVLPWQGKSGPGQGSAPGNQYLLNYFISERIALPYTAFVHQPLHRYITSCAPWPLFLRTFR